MKKNVITFFLFTWLSANLFAQTEEIVSIETETGSLEGTLLTPAIDSKVPVALIIAGSGPTDRDGNNAMMKNNSLKMLASALVENGIATLRYDKRGVGGSISAGIKEFDLRFEHYIEDAKEWLRFLINDGRFSDLIIIGHSQGSLIGMIATQQEKADKFISVAGVGRPAADILREQLKAQPAIVLEMAAPILDSLELGKTIDDVPFGLYSLFRPSIQPYMISWFKYNPQKELAKLDKPVLIIQGTTDIQVTVYDAEMLADSNSKSEKHIIEGMNHIMKESELDRLKNIQTYSQPDLPLIAGLVDIIATFINQ